MPTNYPSLQHLFRKFSRIQLEITDIRVERVNDISEGDSRAEGVYVDITNAFSPTPPRCKPEFKLLWDSINKKRGFGWDVNPYVWVVEFKKLEK